MIYILRNLKKIFKELESLEWILHMNTYQPLMNKERMYVNELIIGFMACWCLMYSICEWCKSNGHMYVEFACNL
jgi:hypothetical protein